jgi:hypothetical protein
LNVQALLLLLHEVLLVLLLHVLLLHWRLRNLL